MDSSRAIASSAAAQGADKGAAVYAAQKCATCHALDGKGMAKGPLDGVGSKFTAAEIHDWIVNPGGDVEEAQRHAQAGDEGVYDAAEGRPRRARRLPGCEEEVARPEAAAVLVMQLDLPSAVRNPISLTGAAIATAMAIVFLALLALDLGGQVHNPYFGLLLFVAVPAGFVFGLLLIPIGIRRQRKQGARR